MISLSAGVDRTRREVGRDEQRPEDPCRMDEGSETLRRLCRPVSFLTPDRVARPPSWLGHVPFAFWLIEALRPNCFVELGTHSGNSYSAFCQAVKHLRLNTACFAVDTWEGDPHAGYYGDKVFRTFTAYHDPRYGAFSRLLRTTFDAAAGHFSDAGIDLLHIDGLHTYEAVRHDFETWLPKMGRRGVVLLHDISVRRDDFGVWRLWEDLATAHPHFAFLHCNGLGVLGVGDVLPEPLCWLFGAQAENGVRVHEIRTFFDGLGGRVARSLTETRAERPVDPASVGQDGAPAALYRRVSGPEPPIERSKTGPDHRDPVLLAREAMVQERDRTIHALTSALMDKDRQIQAIFRSTSWKMSAPVRWLVRLVNGLGGYYRSGSHRMSLKPLQHINRVDGLYESTRGDPAFLLKTNRTRMPSGWCLLSLRVDEPTTTLAPVLYIDRGNGFSDATAVALPLVRGPGWIHQLIRLPPRVTALRLDPTIGRARFGLEEVTIREIRKLRGLRLLISRYGRHWRRGLACLRDRGWAETRRLVAERPFESYETWIAMYDKLTAEDRAAIHADAERLCHKPIISVVMPVFSTPIDLLRQALDSVLDQFYPRWELCVADGSPDPETLGVLSAYQRQDARIKIARRDQNGDVSAARNRALALASGEFVAFMGHDDILPAHALYRVAVELDRHPDADILYSDEDRIDRGNTRHDAYFKPDWNADLMRGQDLVGHLAVYRRALVTAIGGFRPGFEGCEGYDLALRAIERTTPERIRHIPQVLYHRRALEPSAPDQEAAGGVARRALAEHLDRLGTGATVAPAPGPGGYPRVIYPLPAAPPSVTLIVPTRDRVDLLSQCVGGLLEGTDYPDLDIIIVDNGSREPETLVYLASLKSERRVKVLPFDREFNYSAINNFAMGQARGGVIGLINNDIRVIEPGWLREMVSHAIRPEVGAVGAKLLYPDDRVQHAGVITGIRGGVANHVHKFSLRHDRGYFGRLALTQALSCVTAACLVMRKAVYREVGGLDETNLAVSFNDVDLCLRIREKGYLVVWTPHAELHHLESVSRGRDTQPQQRERALREASYMKARWGKALLCDPYYNPNLTLDDLDFSLAFPPRGQKPWLKEATGD